MTHGKNASDVAGSALLAHGWRARLAHVRAITRVGVAVAGSALTALLLPHGMAPATRAVAAWDGFAIIALALTWITILTLRPLQICTLAQREDPSRVLSLAMVVAGAGASLLAVLVLLKSSMSMPTAERMRAIGLALSAVALAWTLIHTVFTLRYAHLFYEDGAAELPLDFPGGDETPDYFDFAYFAFVIGMAAQTADVTIRGRRMRRTALLHGVVSFAFNTAVVALSIGVLTTLL